MRGWVLLAAVAALGAASASAQVPALVPTTATADLVLRRADFAALEYMSLEDLLRDQAGIAVGRRGGIGSPELLQVAGSLNGRVQLIVDGVDIATPEFESPRVYNVQLALIDSVAIWRLGDPARIAIWTRADDSPAPAADFDLGRGTLVSRTRRVQLFTPPRAVTVAVAYDEVLRSGDDFRRHPTVDTASDLGAYDNRALLVQIGLRRGDDLLRVEHLELEDNSHGSFVSQSDRTATHYGRNGLRWQRPLGAARFGLDLGHQAWRQDRQLGGDLQHITEARTQAGLDLELPALRGWSPAARLRHAVTSGDRTTAAGVRRDDRSRQDLQFEAGRDGGGRTGVLAAVHHTDDTALTWSAVARAGTGRGVWEVGARLGRGVAFAGWGEDDPGALRTGVYAAAELARRGARTALQVEALAKSLAGGNSAPAFFPAVHSGPSRLGGLLALGHWQGGAGPWRAHLASSGAWFPEIRGDAAGLPQLQARFDLRGSRALRGGDLIVEVLSTWRLDTRREFSTGPSIAPSAQGDVTLDLRLLQRADFFAGLRNWTDAQVETYPGVLLPSRLLWFGFRVRLLD